LGGRPCGRFVATGFGLSSTGESIAVRSGVASTHRHNPRANPAEPASRLGRQRYCKPSRFGSTGFGVGPRRCAVVRTNRWEKHRILCGRSRLFGGFIDADNGSVL